MTINDPMTIHVLIRWEPMEVSVPPLKLMVLTLRNPCTLSPRLLSWSRGREGRERVLARNLGPTLLQVGVNRLVAHQRPGDRLNSRVTGGARTLPKFPRSPVEPWPVAPSQGACINVDGLSPPKSSDMMLRSRSSIELTDSIDVDGGPLEVLLNEVPYA